MPENRAIHQAFDEFHSRLAVPAPLVPTVIAAKEFFGLRPETTLKDFTEEWKQLTDADKQEIRVGLIANGYNIKA